MILDAQIGPMNDYCLNAKLNAILNAIPNGILDIIPIKAAIAVGKKL